MISFLSLLILQGCSMKGVYTTNPKSKPAFGGTEIIISKNNKISLRSWTDVYLRKIDDDGNRIWEDHKYKGFGTYSEQGDSLEITFANEDSITVIIDKFEAGERKTYQVSIFDELGNQLDPFINLVNDSLETIKSIWEQNKSKATFETTPRTNYSYISTPDLTMFSPKLLIPIKDLHAGHNIIKHKTYAGYYAKGDTIKLYLKRYPFGIRYGSRKSWLAKKYKWDLLNRLYLD